ncbi:hypothetical protein V8E55_002464 [Tylopilus felleus]
MEPNKKCCTTGSFPSDPALYILIMPAFTLSRVADIRSWSMGESHGSDADLMVFMSFMQPKYM